MKCLIVSVNYSDILKYTLPYNKHHFEEILVVTHPDDNQTINIALDNEVQLYLTQSFYSRGAHFNKWSPTEEGLDRLGRSGPLCLLDADIMLPKDSEITSTHGRLIIPKRRMAPLGEPPPENEWGQYPLDNFQGWAGYCMIFNGSDPVLLRRPWFKPWIHAGGGDTEFEQRWRKDHKLRSNFEVLHIGEPRTNWCGRSEADKKRLRKIMENRAINGMVDERL